MTCNFPAIRAYTHYIRRDAGGRKGEEMMTARHGAALIAAIALVLGLAGCNAEFSVNDPESWRDTGITNSLGEATLYFTDGPQTVTTRNSATDRGIQGIQVLGLADSNDRLFVAADPDRDFHPVITSGESSSSTNARVYLTPVGQVQGTNATSYQNIDGPLLYTLASEYAENSFTTTVGNLRTRLAELAYGDAAGLVVCAHQPITSGTGSISSTEVTQRASNLSEAFQAIGWQYIYTNRGYSTSQNLRVWVVDPFRLRLTDSGAGALSDTLIVVVAPSSGSTGDVLPNSLRVELTWDQPVDLDLHLVRYNYNLFDSQWDCYWEYLEQNWGDPYRTTDNPRLLNDDENGYGPETIVLDEMTPGYIYTVAIDYWGDAYGEPTTRDVYATVRVSSKNFGIREYRNILLTDGEPYNGDYRLVCDIDGTTGAVTTANRSITRAAGATRAERKGKQ